VYCGWARPGEFLNAFCLGTPLVRCEAGIAVPRCWRRLPDPELGPSPRPPGHRHAPGLASLPVSFPV
jgi:cytochrome P450